MSELGPLHIDGQTVPVAIHRNSRAKRMTLRVCPRDRLVKITIPPRMSLKKAEDFLHSHSGWILGRLGPAPAEGVPKTIELMGDRFALAEDPLRRKAHVCVETQMVYVPTKKQEEKLYGGLVDYAKKILPPICLDYAESLNHPIRAIRLRDPKSRWGSCSSDKKIMLSWRLVLAPAEVARYVCIHEVCHLEHMDHSQDFWSLVEHFDPEYKTNRKWLKKHGSRLYQVV